MIEAIKEIGKYALEKSGRSVKNPLEILIDDPASSESYKWILAIELGGSAEEGFSFKGVTIEPYSKERIEKYLYKKGSANGPDLSPTSRITEVEKTFNKKTLGWFSNVLKDTALDLGANESLFLNALKSCLVENAESILEVLKSKMTEVDKGQNAILTLKINGKYVSKYPIFGEILTKKASFDYYKKYGKTSKSDSELCSVCKKSGKEVYGFVDTYKFYTVDKPGFVSGGFNQTLAWKNYPVCLNCAIELEAGKKYLKEFMSFSFYGFNYYLIPKLISKEISKEHLNEVLGIFEDFKDKDPKFDQDYINLAREDEKFLLSLLQEKGNYFNNNLLFYEQSNSAFRILLYIEDILPSRLKKLFETKSKVDSKYIFKNFTDEKPLKFTFGNVWQFYPRTREIDLSKYFLEITDKIFTCKKLDYNFLLSGIVRRVRKEFVNDNSTKLSTFLGFQLLDYLAELKQLKNFNGGDYMSEKSALGTLLEEEPSDVEAKASALFEEFGDFFNTDAKRAAFLEGVLTQFLLNIQYQERNSTPFKTKLQGLSLDERMIKSLLPKIQNKLEEYGKNYYRNLEELISKYMVKAGSNWGMTKDEISFYFVLGMNLSNYLKNKKEDE
jgi:CRISPR-associated protein Csh1